MTTCEICHKELLQAISTFDQPYHYTESGLSDVYLVNVTTHSCPNCDVQVADIPRMNELHQLISKVIILTPSPVTGEQFRFLRKETRLRPKEFAERVGVDPKTVANWERADTLNRQNDLAIRFFVAAELFEGNELKKVVSQLNELSEFSWEQEGEVVLDEVQKSEIDELAATNTFLGITSDDGWGLAA